MSIQWVRNKTLRKRDLKKQSRADLYITDQILIYHVKGDGWQEEWGETDKMMAEDFQNEM